MANLWASVWTRCGLTGDSQVARSAHSVGWDTVAVQPPRPCPLLKGDAIPPPPNPRDARADAVRTAQIIRRAAALRAAGTVGALSALGVFTGLAAAHAPSPKHPSTDGVAVAPAGSDSVATRVLESDDQRSLNAAAAAAQRASDFFAQQGSSAELGDQTPAPTTGARTSVAPPIQNAPPATQSTTS